jgi:hypothetical protein
MDRAYSTKEATRNVYSVLVGKLAGKKLLVRHTSKHMWEDNIKIDLSKIGWAGMDWIHLAQDRVQWRAVVNTVMNLRVPQNVAKYLSS